MAETINGFDPDETLPLPDGSGVDDKMEDLDEQPNKTAESERLLSLLEKNVDETTSASLLSHLASLREGGWDEPSCELAMKSFNMALGGDIIEPYWKRMLTDGILPIASTSLPSLHTNNNDSSDTDSSSVAKIVRGVVDSLLSAAFQEQSDIESNIDIANTGQINEGIKILLPTFLHRMDNDESCQSISSAGDAALDGQESVDDILDKFCGHKYKSHPQVTAGVLSALKEFDNISTGRLSKRRTWQKRGNNNSFGQDYTFEFIDRPTCLIRMATASLKTLASSKEHDALPPLVYQLGILPMGLLHADTKIKAKGENEKQRGVRLRKIVLEGIASALEDGTLGLANSNNGNRVVIQGSNTKSDEWRWSRYTSLSHMGTCLRMDPEMSKAVLAMLGGEISHNGGNDAPFRYQRLTPFKLAMGLSMASSVPRMRQAALGCVRDLILEEETIRIRCGLGRDGEMVGFGEPWMLCLVRSLEKVSSGDKNAFQDLPSKNEDGNIGHVLKCLVIVAKFADSSDNGGGMRSGDISCAPMILQSLVTLGFLLIDCVKKDEKSSSTAIKFSTLLGNTLDMSILNGVSSADTSANHSTACTGRMLLSFLFYQSAAASSHFMTSSLSRGSNEGGTSLCRLILKSSIDKLCGMAPNALEYGKVLTDLLQFSPLALTSITRDLEAGCDELDNSQKEQVISLAMATHHIPMLIDTLSNVPGGGMNHTVASEAIIPTVGHLLLLQASSGSLRPGLAGYLWKKNDIIDHVDHGYLLAKKSLFCLDEDKRRCAAKMLVSLLGTAVVASSGGNKRTSSKWAPVLDEMRSSLRRCLQHQQSVRIEAYSSLMAILPSSDEVSEASQTQESESPKSTSTGVATQSPNPRTSRTKQSQIPPIAREGVTDLVCGILLSQLERCMTTPPEHIQDKKARQQRGNTIGTLLSQPEEVEQSQEIENSMPFRFESFISTRRQQDKSQGKKKSTSVAQSLLNEALNRISEPLGFLIASCSCSVSFEINCADDLNNHAQLSESVNSLRRRMAGCIDIEQYLKWLKSNKQIFQITNNTERKKELAIGKLATLICIATAAEVLLGTLHWDNEDDDGFIGVDTTNKEVQSLFNLRVNAINRASEIMSSFVSSKPKKKKLKERDANADESEPAKKRKSKQSKQDEDGMDAEEGGLETTTELNRAMLAKNAKILEEAINRITPAPPQDFMASILTKFGAQVETKLVDSDDVDSEDESDEAITKRLASCMVFRRFVITKSILLLSGASPVVNAGSPFTTIGDNTNTLIACSLKLGPLLFAEFCSHSYHLERTSISPDTSSSQESSLSQLSIRAFTLCVKGMASPCNHAMSRARRVMAILNSASRFASQSSQESWKHYEKLSVDDSTQKSASREELDLNKVLLPFISHRTSSGHICLFEELLSQAMHREAMEFANMILSAASAFTDPNLRERLGVIMLQCYEKRDGKYTGVLGLDFGNDEYGVEHTYLASVIGVGFSLSNGLDGDTHAPLPIRQTVIDNMENSLRLTRAQVGLPMTDIQNWPNKHQDHLRAEIISSKSCGMGIVQKISWALTVALADDVDLENVLEPPGLSKRSLKLRCISSLSKTPDSNVIKEKSNICQLISSCIDSGLDNADYLTAKLIPNLSENALDLSQRFVACNLLSVSKVLCASAPSAEFVDYNGSFASSLLKHAKRLYSNLVRFILSYTSNPKCMASNETKAMFDFMTSTLKPRIAALLHTLRDKQETASGKYLAESRIESHGRTASQLVFEKEKLDNALLKVGAILKQAGLEEESKWLSKHVVTSRDTGFKVHNIAEAKKREAPKEKKSAGSKRKVKREPTEKKKKAKVERDNENASDDDVSRENSEVSEDEVVAEVVSGADLTKDMGDDSEEEDEDEMNDQSEDDESSEEENEFD